MNNNGNNNIPSSKNDDGMLTKVTEDVYKDIKNKYLCKIPDNWNFECKTKKIEFKDIQSLMVQNGISPNIAKKYYGEDSSIITDAHIIFLTMLENNNMIAKPLFMGEMKKQGTNDKRLREGKKRQAIGNAAPDRVAKNFEIASDFCYLCNKDFFPYNVFLHGCDFKESEMTVTTKAKLLPFFGELNVLNPYFDKNIFWGRKGGSCFYQHEDYTYEQLYKYCYECCELGINYYLSNYIEK